MFTFCAICIEVTITISICHSATMVIIGNTITVDDVIADPRYKDLKPSQVTTKILSMYTMEQKETYEQDALKTVNAIKNEFGSRESTLVRIYNGSGCTLRFSKQHDWHGYLYKYPTDHIILNGQWSVFLHVSPMWPAPHGDMSCVIYSIQQEKADVFMGWDDPLAGSNSVYTEISLTGRWPDSDNWDRMDSRIDDSGKNSASKYNAESAPFYSDATIGDSTSPLADFTVSVYNISSKL